jgi:hypothetical protein
LSRPKKAPRHPDFKLPVRTKITGRKSTLTNLFLNSITPCIEPTADEVREALAILGMEHGCTCAYCGDKHTEWDHLRPIVVDHKPTGFITEIANLVPACGKCNQSKGNKNWHDWITSDIRLSPTRRGVPGLAQRIKRLKAFEAWRQPIRLDYGALIGEAEWLKHMSHLSAVIQLLENAETHASGCRNALASSAKSAHLLRSQQLAA